MILRSIGMRMFLLVFGLVAVVQLALLIAVNTANHRIGADAIDRHLASGERLFHEVFHHREEQLVLATQVLSADFAFRRAVGTGDLDTAVSALENLARRIGADTAILVGPDGRILADTVSRANAGRPIEEVLHVSWGPTGTAGIGWVGDEALQLLAAEVRAPLPIARLVMGFEIDDRLATELRQLTGLEIAFVGTDRESPHCIAATVKDIDWNHLIEKVGGTTQTPDRRYEAIVTPLGASYDTDILAILLVPREAILGPFRWLGSLLLGLAFIGLAISAFGSVGVSRGITRPLSSMAAIARRYADGDFEEAPNPGRADELGLLARALTKMRDGLLERERKILRLAYYDSLTELANRTLLRDRLSQSIALSRRQSLPLTVMVLDLDRFKEVNGTLGHSCGDQVLREVGARLRRVVRESDTIARLGGDEFALVLNGTDAEGASVLAAKIHEVMLDPVSVEGDGIDVSVSIGGSVFPDHGDDGQVLLSRADIALYAAKETMSGFTMFDPTLDADRRSQLTLLGQLRRALENNEIELWYQPKIDTRSGVATEVEALVRWRHPDRGIVNPADFIDFAERTGFIKEITLHVLDLAARQSAMWNKLGIDLRIAVNVSAKDLYDGALPDHVAASLARYGAQARNLAIEITETAMMVSPDKAMAVLHRLREEGIAIAIDDFGVGYSSLSYLKRLPVQELKVDRVFVANMMSDPEAEAIVRAAVDLGHTMGMKVVAEGVEDAETWESLSALGCDFAQGYWFSKPLPPAELDRWLRESRWAPVGATV